MNFIYGFNDVQAVRVFQPSSPGLALTTKKKPEVSLRLTTVSA